MMNIGFDYLDPPVVRPCGHGPGVFTGGGNRLILPSPPACQPTRNPNRNPINGPVIRFERLTLNISTPYDSAF